MGIPKVAYFIRVYIQTDSEPCKTSGKEFFGKLVNGPWLFLKMTPSLIFVIVFGNAFANSI